MPRLLDTISLGKLRLKDSIVMPPMATNKETPKELNIEEIDELVEAFGQAARRAVEAGFDAVEVHGAHGFLLNQFLSPPH